MRTAITAVIGTALISALSMASAARAAEDKVASNGVKVMVDGGEFSPRTDYEIFTKTPEGGYAFAVTKEKSGAVGYIVQGYAIYKGDWRHYDRAYLSGGDKVQFDRLRSKVLGCDGHSTSDCTLEESYQLTLTKEQAAAASTAGLRVQVSSQSPGNEILVTVPAEQFQAAEELAGVKP